MANRKRLILLVIAFWFGISAIFQFWKISLSNDGLLNTFSRIAHSFLNGSDVSAANESSFVSRNLSTSASVSRITTSNVRSSIVHVSTDATITQIEQSLIDKSALYRKFPVATLNCPEKTRVGGEGDGGKWTCRPRRASGDDCVVYSLGVNGDVSFENGIYEISGRRCRIYSFDVKAQPEKLFAPFNGTFMQIKLAATTDKSEHKSSLFDIMRGYNHTKLEILKMDIEEAEFDVMNSFLKSVEITPAKTAFCQFLVEFHAFDDLNKKITLWIPLFEKLDQAGFRLFSTENNVACCDEFSFMHVSCFGQYGLL